MSHWSIRIKEIEIEFKNNIDNFLRQPAISRALHPNIPSIAKQYYDLLNTHYSMDKLADNPVGNPYLPIENNLSLNTLQSLYYVWKGSLSDTNYNTITDVGGGYGTMCRIMYHYGFAGNYNIIDFDVMHDIQKRVLSEYNINDVEFSKLEDIALKGGNNSLLIATFSMNEMPLKDREIIERNIHNYDTVFIAHNRNFDGIDNIEYFDNLEKELQDTYNIRRFTCPVVSWHRYFIGTRR